MGYWNGKVMGLMGLACLLVTVGCAEDSESSAVNATGLTEGEESPEATVETEEESPVEEDGLAPDSEGSEDPEELPEEEGGEGEVVDLSCEPVGGESPTWYGDIERIFFENCQVCHGDTPLYGAPMSLSSYGDMEGASFSSEAVSMIEMIGARVADGTMPPSSQMPMPEGDRLLLEQWVAECGPEGDPSESNLEEPVKAQVPPAPADAIIMEFSANEFDVPLKDDHYQCFPFTIYLDDPMDIVRFDFELDEAAVIHHLVLYGDPDNEGGDTPFECGGVAVDHSEFMYAWAPGGQPLQFPEGFGFPVKDGDKVLLQVHYNNVQKIEGLADSSKVKVYMSEPKEEQVGMSAIGPLKISVPPFSEAFSESACTINEPVTMLTSAPHMHETGKKFRQIVVRADGTEELIVQVENWDFNEQPNFHTPVELNPGDRLITRCDFENPHAYTVKQGDNTEEEMCFNFTYLYPPLGGSFCDEPIDLEASSALDDVPGECAEGIVMAPAVEGVGTVGTVEDANYLTELPEGEYVLAEFEAMLDPSLLDDYQLNLEKSQVKAQASMKVEAKVEGEDQSVIVDLDVGLILSVGNGGSFPLNNASSFEGTLKPSEVEGAGMNVDEAACDAGALSLTRIRVVEASGNLEGYLSFAVPFGGLEEIHYGVTFARVEDEE